MSWQQNGMVLLQKFFFPPCSLVLFFFFLWGRSEPKEHTHLTLSTRVDPDFPFFWSDIPVVGLSVTVYWFLIGFFVRLFLFPVTKQKSYCMRLDIVMCCFLYYSCIPSYTLPKLV